jgi:hypothetical protein
VFESRRDKGPGFQVAVGEQNSPQKSQAEGDPVELDGVGQAETNGIEKNGLIPAGKYSPIAMKEEREEDEFLRIGRQQRVQKHDQEPDPRPASGKA